MKKISLLVLAFVFLFSFTCCNTNETCTSTPTLTPTTTPTPFYQKTEPFGTIPEEFKKIVEDNTFNHGIAFSDRVLKYTEENDCYNVFMYDLYGKTLASCKINKLSYRNITTLLATSDGGFLVSIGFNERYLVSEGIWAGELGVSSKIIKYDNKGNIHWETELEDFEGETLNYSFENDGYYYFFGEVQSADSKTLGVYSPTDIHALKLDGNGQVVGKISFGGSDYDSLQYAKADGNSFILYVRSQLKNGNNYKIENQKIELSGELEIVSEEKTENYMFDSYLGVIDGKIISSSDLDDSYTKSLGNLDMVLDYKDFYLTVAQNPTDLYNKQPSYISSLLFYWETVYSAYNKNGELIWRASVESTPDYSYLNNQIS